MSFVYFIQRGEDGPIKIGHSENPIGRLSTLQIGCSEKLRLLGSMSGSAETERALHAAYANYRMSGEWFQPAETLVQLALAYQDYTAPVNIREQFDVDGLSERLKARRKQLGLSQRSVCHAAGLSDAYVSILERGARHVVGDPGVATIAAIAVVLKCCPAWLAFGVGEAPRVIDIPVKGAA